MRQQSEAKTGAEPELHSGTAPQRRRIPVTARSARGRSPLGGQGIRVRQRDRGDSLVSRWPAPGLLHLVISSPRHPQRISASRSAWLQPTRRLRMCTRALVKPPILRSPIRRLLHAAARPDAIERRGRSPVGGTVPSTPDRTYPFFRSERRPKRRPGEGRARAGRSGNSRGPAPRG